MSNIRGARTWALSAVASVSLMVSLLGSVSAGHAEELAPPPTAAATAPTEPTTSIPPSASTEPSPEPSLPAEPSPEPSLSTDPSPSQGPTGTNPAQPSQSAAPDPVTPPGSTTSPSSTPTPSASTAPATGIAPPGGVLPAAEVATGSITGVVTGPDSQPLEGVAVELSVDLDGVLDPQTIIHTDSEGRYAFGDLANGTYSLFFWAEGYGSMYLGGAPIDSAAERLQVTGEIVNQDARLAEAATIAGRITGPREEPIEGASVELFWRNPGSGTDVPLNESESGADGDYAMTSLVAGAYTLRISRDGYLGEWYDNQTDQLSATPVPVTAGDTATANAMLDAVEQPVPTGSVSGTVRGGGSPLPGVLVTLYGARDSGGSYSYHAAGSTRTDSDGNYSFTELENGTYSLFFDDNNGYLDRWLGGSPDSAHAVTFEVADILVEQDVELPLGTAVSGTISGDDGPLAGASVTLYRSCGHGCGDHLRQTSTDPNGHYSFIGLEDDVYSLSFEADGYVRQWLGGSYLQSSSHTFSTSTANLVIPNVRLVRGGSISGAVTGGDRALAGVVVELYGFDTERNYYTQLKSAWTDGAGKYSFSALPNGSFTLYLRGTDGHVSEWLGGAESSSAADKLTISAAGSVVRNVTLVMGGSVSGTVTDGELPMSTGYLDLYRYDRSGSASYVTRAYVAEDGRYSFVGLSGGDYTLSIRPSGGVGEWLGGAANSDSAERFTITPPNAIVQDVQLADGGSVSGSVSGDDGGGPLSGVRVDLYRYSQGYAGYVTYTFTDGGGNYSFRGLADGEYTLNVAGTAGYAGQWLGGASDSTDADRVAIAMANEVVRNVLLVRGASVSGTVTGDNGPLAGVWVEVYPLNGAGYTSTRTATDGSYSFGGLADGTYTLHFSDSHGYVSTWLGGADELESADTFALPSDEPIVIDIQLVRGGSVSGTTSGVDGPLGNIQLELYEWLDNSVSYVTDQYTNFDGTHAFVGLPDGTYTLYIVGRNGYRSEWLGGASNASTARKFTIAAANSVVQDVQLSLGGSISGVVTGADGPLRNVLVQLYDVSGDEPDSVIQSVSTDQDGHYSLIGLRDGAYTLYFHGTGGHVSSWLGGGEVPSAATKLLIDAANSVTGNVQLIMGGTVSGTVVGDGTPLANSSVQLYKYSGDGDVASVDITDTDSAGHFSFGGVRSGRYTLHIARSGPYLGEWLGGSSTSETAVSFMVTAGGAVVVPDTHLALGGSVTGSVSGDGQPLEGTTISLYRTYQEDGSTGYDWIDSTSSDADGHYRIDGLASGTYSLSAELDGYVTTWLGGGYDEDSASTFTIAAAETRSADLQLERGATVTGVVTGPHGEGVEDAYVEVFRYDASQRDYEHVGYQHTTTNGSYAIGSLREGTYKLSVEAPWGSDYVSEWWNNRWDEATADSFELTAGGTADRDVTLDPGAAVVGHATEIGNGPLPSGTEVALERWHDLPGEAEDHWDDVDSVAISADGAFSFARLTPGTYRLLTEPFGSEHVETFTIDVAEGTVTHDIAVSSGAWISGRVIDASGSTLSGTDISARDRSGRTAGRAFRAPDGGFTVKGLVPGVFTVVASSTQADFPDRYYGDASSLKAASFLTVTDPAERLTGVDIAYGAGETIQGTVTEAGTGLPIQAAGVSLVTRNGNTVAYDTTDALGRYSLQRVPAGIYALAFRDRDTGVHLDQWWGGEAGSSSRAQYFSVSADTLTRDVQLVKAGSITGTLSGFGGYAGLGLYQRDDEGSFEEIDYRDIDPPDQDHGSAAGFTFDGLNPGEYYLHLEGRSNAGTNLDYWWRDAPFSDTATPITAVAGAATDVGAIALTQPVGTGSVRGTIAAPPGTNWSGSAVELQRVDGDWTRYSDQSIAADGGYEISRVPAGTYLINLSYGGSGAYQSSYHPAALTRAAATAIEVRENSTTAADLTLLARTASVAGTVTGPLGEKIANAEVALYVSTPSDPFADYVTFDTTDAQGRYSFASRLVPGKAYSITVHADDYLTAYYGGDGATSGGSFVAGSTSAVDVAMQVGATVSGKVTDARDASDGVGGVDVHLVPVTGGDVQSVSTRDDGTYQLDTLRPGSYLVRYGSYTGPQGIYAPSWYGGGAAPSQARVLTLSGGQVVTGIDGSLTLAGEISGAVSGVLGGRTSWLDIAVVTLYTSAGEELAVVTAGNGGAPGGYSFTVPPGSYKVCAGPPAGYSGLVSCAGSASPDGRLAARSTTAGDSVGQAGLVTVTAGRDTYVDDLDIGTVAPVGMTGPVPTISGLPRAGQTLTANAGIWQPGDVTFTYRWYVGTLLVGQQSTYLVAPGDAGKVISVTVTGTKPGYPSLSKTSAGLAVGLSTLTSAPVPLIAGTAATDQVLTALPGTWAPQPVTLSYQWRRGGTVIPAATSSTYRLTASDVGMKVSVTVTGTKAGYTPVSRTSSEVTASARVFATAPTPTISGSPRPGSVLTASAGAWSPAPAALAYQWLRGGTPISDATGSRYTVQVADGGSTLSVRVTGSRPGYVSAVRLSVPTARVPAHSLTQMPIPTISGTAKVGRTLTAKAGTWGPSPVALAYQWRRNGSPIGGAVKSTYLLQGGDAGRSITVTVTGSKLGYTAVAKTSKATVKVAKGTLGTATPRISGSARVGATLTVQTGAWKPSPVGFKYQWYRSGRAISRATKATYVLGAADKGRKITVKVTGSKTGYTTATKTSSSTRKVAAGTLGASVPTIVGPPRVGSVVVANQGKWTPAGVSFGYQWYRSGSKIPKATKSSYKLVPGDKGKKLTVRVSGSKAGYATASRTSRAIVVIP